MAPGSMPKNIETLVMRFEDDWEEFKESLLSGQGEARPRPNKPGHGWKVIDNTNHGRWISQSDVPEEALKTGGGAKVTPIETETILQKIEQVNHEVQILDRISKLERQYRKITLLGAIFLTIMAVAIAALALAIMQPTSPPVGRLSELGKGLVSPPHHEVPQLQESSKPMTAPAAPVKFVGSITSNKYHDPDCKWAKTIQPGRLVTFHSVQEASDKGYKRCPVCKPSEPAPAAGHPGD